MAGHALATPSPISSAWASCVLCKFNTRVHGQPQHIGQRQLFEVCVLALQAFDFSDTVNEELLTLTHRRLPSCVGTYNARVNWINERGERYDLSADLALGGIAS